MSSADPDALAEMARNRGLKLAEGGRYHVRLSTGGDGAVTMTVKRVGD